MGLVYLLRQFPLPGTGGHGRSESPDADCIGQGEPGQPFVADALQGTAQLLIILFADPLGVVLPKFSFETGEQFPNHSKLLRQCRPLPCWAKSREEHRYPIRQPGAGRSHCSRDTGSSRRRRIVRRRRSHHRIPKSLHPLGILDTRPFHSPRSRGRSSALSAVARPFLPRNFLPR